MTKAIQQYIDLYRQHAQTVAQHSADALNVLRSDALHVLESTAFPEKGEEDYEATDLTAAFAPDYGVNINRRAFSPDAMATPILSCLALSST